MKTKTMVVIVLTIINATAIYYVQKLQKTSSQQIYSVNSELQNYKYSIRKIYEAKNVFLNNDFVILNDSIKIKLSDLNLTKKIIFWHSSLSCNTCVDYEIDYINNLDDTLRSQFIVFVDSMNYVLYNRLRRHLKNEIFIVRANHQLFSNSDYNLEPFYFTIDNEMYITSIFLPNKMKFLSKCEYIEAINN